MKSEESQRHRTHIPRARENGVFPINFRFYKIFNRTTRKPIHPVIAKKMPIFEIFYLYVDLVLDEKTNTKTVFFNDPLLKFCFENDLWVRKNNFRVIKPDVLTKIRMLENRDTEKRVKDVMNCLMVLNFSDFNIDFFKEISDIFKIDKKTNKLAFKIVNSPQIQTELADLRFSMDEIQNVRTSLIAMLKL